VRHLNNNVQKEEITWCQRGFSLFDLMISIMILGIISMIIVPQYHSLMTQTKLNGAAGELVSALEYARSLAVKYQRPFQVNAWTDQNTDEDQRNQFMVKDSRYSSDSNVHLDADPPVYDYGIVFNPLDKKPYIIDFDKPMAYYEGIIETKREYEGIVIKEVAGGNKKGEVEFYPTGHLSTMDKTFVLQLGEEKRTIIIEVGTGRITVQ